MTFFYHKISLQLLALSIVFSGFYGGTTSWAKEVNMNEILKLSHPFPKDLKLKNLKDHQIFEWRILSNTTCRLIRNKADQLHPELAERWEISPDGLTYVFYLRKGAKFQDGSPITTDDVFFSIKRSLLYGGQYASRYLPKLIGNQALTSVASKIAGLEKMNDHQFKMTFNAPVTTLIEDLATFSFNIFSKESVDTEQDVVKSTFLSSGPYQVKEFSNTKIILSLNPHHWMFTSPRLFKEIHIVPMENKDPIKMLVQGEIDYWHLQDSLLNEKDLKSNHISKQMVGPGLIFLAADFKGPLLSLYPQFAKDFQVFLNRSRMVQAIDKETGISYQGATHITASIDQLEAEELTVLEAQADTLKIRALIKTTYPKIASGELPLVIGVTEKDKSGDIVKALIQELSKIGVSVRLNTLAFTEITANHHVGKYDFGLRRHLLDARKPALAIQFFAGTDPTQSNLPEEHGLFTLYKKIPEIKDYSDHIKLLGLYNQLNDQTGFVIPLVRDSLNMLFSSKVDVSMLPEYDFMWHLEDLRMATGASK